MMISVDTIDLDNELIKNVDSVLKTLNIKKDGGWSNMRSDGTRGVFVIGGEEEFLSLKTELHQYMKQPLFHGDRNSHIKDMLRCFIDDIVTRAGGDLSLSERSEKRVYKLLIKMVDSGEFDDTFSCGDYCGLDTGSNDKYLFAKNVNSEFLEFVKIKNEGDNQ